MTTFILSKEQFQQFQTNFRRESTDRSISTADIILYNIFRGKDPTHGFTCITNPTKLAHKMDPWLGYERAKRKLKYEFIGWTSGASVQRRFGAFIDTTIIQQIIAVLDKAVNIAKEKKDREFKISSKRSNIASIQMWLDNLDKSTEQKKTQLEKLQSELHEMENL